jgi:3-isopropylmalate/(R)-2-methylmalate dehydratase small subunit
VLAIALVGEDCYLFLDTIKLDPPVEMLVDSNELTVSVAKINKIFSFQLDPFVRYRLLNRLHDIGLTLSHESDINKYETN